MVTKAGAKKAAKPPWVKAFLKSYKPPTPAELRRRKKAVERAFAIREHLDIRPLTTGELVRQLRDERE